MDKGSHAMFIGAYVDHVILPKMGAYAASKAGLDALVQVLARENRRQRWTLVRPGAVDTDFWQQVSFRKPADTRTPAEIAQKLLDWHEDESSADTIHADF